VALVVMKFGGAALSDIEKMRRAADIIKEEYFEGNSVIAVLSAPGDTTDELTKLGHKASDTPDKREMDALVSVGEQISIALCAMILKDGGVDAVSVSGRQLGIITDDTYTDAEIIGFSGEIIEKYLKEGKIVVAAGFQGITENGDITTLGRGGSDTTAVYLSRMLGGKTVRMYKDVDGIFTADPKKDKNAKKLDTLTYDEMMKLIENGAGVLHSKCVQMAKKFGIKILVLPFNSKGSGSIVG